MAADIVEFNEIYTNDIAINDIKIIGGANKLLHGVMGVWALAVLQFSLTIILPEEGLKQEEKEEPVELQNMSYFRKIKSNHVVPMSYMHYKSMLREDTLDAGKITSQQKNPVLAQIAFRQKYKNPLNTFQTSNLTSDLQSLKVDSNEEIFLNDGLTFPLPITSEEKTSALKGKKFVSLANGLKYPPKIDSPSSSKTEDFSYTRSPATISPQSNISQDGHETFNKTSSDSDIEEISSGRILFKPSLSKNPLINQRQSDSDHENSLGIGKNEVKKCCLKYLELIGILLALCMQDGPFFIFRFVLVARYQVVTEMMILLTIKNALVIVVQIYRILNLYCTEPKQEELEDEHASHRIRNALHQNEEMSELSSKRQRAALALTALARMRTMAENKGQGVKQNSESEINEFQNHGQTM